MRFYLLDYDIHGRGNPSRILHGVAVRHTESVWIVPENCVSAAWRIQQQLAALNHAVGIHGPFEAVEADSFMALVQRKLGERIVEIQNALDKAVLKARQHYEEGEALQAVAPIVRGRNYARSSLSRAKRELMWAEEMALHFGLTGSMSQAISSLQSSIAAQHHSIYTALGLRMRGTK